MCKVISKWPNLPFSTIAQSVLCVRKFDLQTVPEMHRPEHFYIAEAKIWHFFLLVFFSPRRLFAFVVRMPCISVDFTSVCSVKRLQFLRLATHHKDDFSLYMLHFLAYSGYVRKIRWQCLCAINYTGNFLHLETHESQTCLTLAKNSLNGGTQPNSCTKI